MINVAQIGVGYWGPNLLRNLISNQRCQVKIVADLSKERREYVKRMYPSVDVTDDVGRVFSDKLIDAVIIATPVFTHYDLAIRALDSGKHILVEKPIATTVEEAEQIGLISSNGDLVAMVGHTFLYNSAVRYVKDMINSGDLGDIRYIYSQRLNLGRIRTDVDVLWNLAPHDISIIQYWLGDIRPLSVLVHGIDYIQKGINDVAFMNIVYPNKVMANIHVSWLDPRKVRCMTVVGSKKMVVYDDVSEDKIIIYDKGIDSAAVLGENMDFDSPGYQIFKYRSGDIILPRINFEEPLKVEIDHFFDCIEKRIPCMTGMSHAIEVVRILSKDYQSDDKPTHKTREEKQ
jgi:predicted dehydrogenase